MKLILWLFVILQLISKLWSIISIRIHLPNNKKYLISHLLIFMMKNLAMINSFNNNPNFSANR